MLHALIDRARYDLVDRLQPTAQPLRSAEDQPGPRPSSLRPPIKTPESLAGEGDYAMNCQDHLYRNADPRQVTRRWFFEQCGVGLGPIALGQLLQTSGLRRRRRPRPRPSIRWPPRRRIIAPKAKRVIFLFMAGAPSHLELFDNKPQLAKFDGTLPPAELIKGYRAAFIKPSSKLLGPEVQVRPARPVRHRALRAAAAPGRRSSTTSPSSRAMVTDAFNHAPGQIMMSTGSQIFGRPSMGAWVSYGLGSESQDLPGFVVFSTGKKGPSGGNSNWGSGFLPTVYQGVQFRTSGDPVLYLSNPRGVDRELQRDSLDAVQQAQPAAARARSAIPRSPPGSTPSRWPSACSSTRPERDGHRPTSRKHILDMYGAEPGKPSFANTCLLARRLLERGVRFVQIFHEVVGPARQPGRTTSRRTARTPTRPAPPWSRT